jgi:hypothetical protein
MTTPGRNRLSLPVALVTFPGAVLAFVAAVISKVHPVSHDDVCNRGLDGISRLGLNLTTLSCLLLIGAIVVSGGFAAFSSRRREWVTGLAACATGGVFWVFAAAAYFHICWNV